MKRSGSRTRSTRARGIEIEDTHTPTTESKTSMVPTRLRCLLYLVALVALSIGNLNGHGGLIGLAGRHLIAAGQSLASIALICGWAFTILMCILCLLMNSEMKGMES